MACAFVVYGRHNDELVDVVRNARFFFVTFAAAARRFVRVPISPRRIFLSFYLRNVRRRFVTSCRFHPRSISSFTLEQDYVESHRRRFDSILECESILGQLALDSVYVRIYCSRLARAFSAPKERIAMEYDSEQFLEYPGVFSSSSRKCVHVV